MRLLDNYDEELIEGTLKEIQDFMKDYYEKPMVDVNDIILKVCKPFMKKYDLDYLELVRWGTYDQYELAGEECDYDVFEEANFDHWNKKFNLEEDWDVMDELDVFNEFWDDIVPFIISQESKVKHKYGSGYGVQLLVINKVGDKYNLSPTRYEL